MNFLTQADLQGAGNLLLDPRMATIGIRPEHLELTAAGNGMIAAEVAVKEQLGGECYLYLNTASGGKLVAKTDGDDATAMGDAIGVNLPENRIHKFNAAGDAISVR